MKNNLTEEQITTYRKEGYLIIEDISKLAEDLYQVILFIVNNKFSINIYTNNSCLVAVLKKS